jgi:hypothetical protein
MTKQIIIADVTFERTRDPDRPQLKIWHSTDKRIIVSGTSTTPMILTVDGVDLGRFTDAKLAMKEGVARVLRKEEL